MLELLIYNALFITGLYMLNMYEVDRKGNIVTKMPLWFIKYNVKKITGDYWIKPLFGCVVCMSSVWGTLFYWTNLIIVSNNQGGCTENNWIILIMYVIYIVMLSGIQKIICHFINEC